MSETQTETAELSPRKPSRPARPARPRKAERSDELNPVWFKPVMFGFMLLGLAWIVAFYVSSSALPIPSLRNWNILIGFGIAFVGFLMATKWK